MKPRLIIFVISLMALAIFYGCSNSGGGHFINQTGDVDLTSREGVINEQGRLSASITFPSGAKIETLEANTLTPGISTTPSPPIPKCLSDNFSI